MLLIRTLNGFQPADMEAAEECHKIKPGRVVRADIVQVRNPQFMRKYFVLLRVLFDLWSEGQGKAEYKGQTVMPNFKRFRHDVAILCGYYTPVFNVRGDTRLEAKSISFSSMGEQEFATLYSQTIDCALQKILPNRGFTAEELNEMADQIIQFA